MANEQKESSTTSILSLPTEVLSEVLARVASSSSTDLFRTKLWFVLVLMIQTGFGVFLFVMCFSFEFNGSFLLFCTCKLFYEVSEANNIYQQVSLDKFEIVLWQENDKLKRFLKKCRESKNPEVLFRKGVVDYFTDKHEDSALEFLEEAANSEHADAAYALGIIYIFVGGDELWSKGRRLLSGMKKFKILKGRVKLCRDNLRALLRMIWVKNPVFLNPTPICCAMTHERKTSSWPMDADEVEESTCDGCACDEEIREICATLPYR